jgi:amidase
MTLRAATLHPTGWQMTAQDFGAFVPGTPCTQIATSAGLLDGLRFAVKDLIDIAGCRTGGGNPDWLRDQIPAARSAPVVTALLANGASLAGKSMTDELAFSLEGANTHYGTPINPACPDRIPGGSSSGSAVAVAGGLADFAIGTDTGGSVRIPASFVGVFGMRPSHGAITLEGVTPFAPSYDTVGWFARNANVLNDVGAILLPKQDAPKITRLLLVRDAFDLADPSTAKALRRAAEDWPVSGEVTIFEGEEETWRECYRVLQGREIWQSLGPWIAKAKPRFGENIGPRFADAATITVGEANHYRTVRGGLATRVNALTRQSGERDTALVIPTAPCAALERGTAGPLLGEFYRRALTLTSIAGHSGAPQISLPAGHDHGCPIGLSIVGATGADLALLDLAAQLAASMSKASAPEASAP